MVSTPGSYHESKNHRHNNLERNNQLLSGTKSEEASTPMSPDENAANSNTCYQDYSRDVSPPGSDGQVMTIA